MSTDILRLLRWLLVTKWTTPFPEKSAAVPLYFYGRRM